MTSSRVIMSRTDTTSKGPGEVATLFSFPNPVNDKAARTVAGVVLAGVIVTLVTGWFWLLIPITYGFWARVLTGPTLSPLGWLASQVVAPRLGPAKPVPGPPKRFAQGMGAVMTTAAAILALAAGQHTAADVILVGMIAAAGLESIFAYCLGCQVFGILMRLGIVPEEVCAENNVHITVGKEDYYLSSDGYLMPIKKNQAPPDVRYFKKTGN